MLKLIRENKNNFVVFVVAGFCALLMVGFGIGSFGGPQQRFVAKINGEDISYRELAEAERQIEARLRQQFGEQYDAISKSINIRQQAVDRLVNDAVLNKFIKESRLSVGTKLIQEEVAKLPYFAGQPVSKEKYSRFLSELGMSGQRFERLMGQEMVRSQLQDVFSVMSAPTKAELKAIFLQNNAEASFRYGKLATKDFENKVPIDNEEELSTFFIEAQEKYRTPRQVSFQYVEFSPAEYASKVDLTENDLMSHYNENKPNFYTKKEVHLRQIVFNIDKSTKDTEESSIPFLSDDDATKDESLESQASEKTLKIELARGIVERLDNGEEFAALAKEVSEDIDSKEKGGDLGFLTYDKIDSELREAAKNLTAGEHSQVTVTNKGLYILFAEEIKPRELKPFDAVKAEIETALRQDDAPLYAFAEAEAFEIELNEKGPALETFTELVKDKSLSAKSSDGLTSISNPSGNAPAGLVRKALELDQGDVQTIELGKIAFVIFVNEAKESFLPELADVKEQVIEDFKTSRAEELAKEYADSVLEEAKAKGGLDALKDKEHLALQMTELINAKNFSPTSPGPFLNPEVRNSAFSLRKESPLAEEVFRVGQDYYLVELVERNLPDESEFQAKHGEILQTERRLGASRLSESLLNVLKTASEIEINSQLIGS